MLLLLHALQPAMLLLYRCQYTRHLQQQPCHEQAFAAAVTDAVTCQRKEPHARKIFPQQGRRSPFGRGNDSMSLRQQIADQRDATGRMSQPPVQWGY